MEPTSHKRKADSELGSSPPTKRRDVRKKVTPTPRVSHQLPSTPPLSLTPQSCSTPHPYLTPHPHSTPHPYSTPPPYSTSQPYTAPHPYSTSQRSSSTPIHRPFVSPAAPVVSVSPVKEDVEEDEEVDELLCRIHSGIKYVTEQHRRGEAIGQTTRFEIDISKVSIQPGLELLRRHGTLVSSSPHLEIFELGIPRPDWVKQGGIASIHDPQWWVGATATQIKAGPFAEEQELKKAAATLKGLQTKRNKKQGMTSREMEIYWKLRVGLRRQEARLKMWGDDDSDRSEEDTGSSDEDGEEEEEEGKQDYAIVAPRRWRWRPVVEDSEDEE